MFDAYEAIELENLQKAEISFPQYRIDKSGTQFFKLLSKTSWINTRDDWQVTGIGISKEMPIVVFSQVYYFQKCTPEEYYAKEKEIYLKCFDAMSVQL